MTTRSTCPTTRTVARGSLAAAAVLCVVASGCSHKGSDSAQVDAGPPPASVLPTGTRQIERIQYNDVTDMYRVFLIGRPNPNEPERLQFLRFAHISDHEMEKGMKPYMKADAGGPVAYVGSSFTIGLIHGVVEERPDPVTHAQANVVTRSEKHWWAPFGGKKLLDGADPYADPAFIYPPVPSTGALTGIGGRGPTKEAAAENYRIATGSLPEAVKLKNEGYKSPKDEEAPVLPKIPVDPLDAVNNKVIGVAPGSPADRARKAQDSHRGHPPGPGKKTKHP